MRIVKQATFRLASVGVWVLAAALLAPALAAHADDKQISAPRNFRRGPAVVPEPIAQDLAAKGAALRNARRALAQTQAQVDAAPAEGNNNELFARKRLLRANLQRAEREFGAAANAYANTHTTNLARRAAPGAPLGVQPVQPQAHAAVAPPPPVQPRLRPVQRAAAAQAEAEGEQPDASAEGGLSPQQRAAQLAAQARRQQLGAQQNAAQAADAAPSSEAPVAQAEGPRGPQLSPVRRAQQGAAQPGAAAEPAASDPAAGAIRLSPAERQVQLAAQARQFQRLPGLAPEVAGGEPAPQPAVADGVRAAGMQRAFARALAPEGIVAEAVEPLPTPAERAPVLASAAQAGNAAARAGQAPQAGRRVAIAEASPSEPGAPRLGPRPVARPRLRAKDLVASADGIRATAAHPWAARRGAVALDDMYHVELETEGHLYGRSAYQYKQVFDALPTEGKPASFEGWCKQLREGTPTVGQAEVANLRANHIDVPTEVEYLSPAQQARRVVRTVNGRIQTDAGAEAEPGANIVFVVRPNGQVLAGKYVRGRFHHSSLVAGENVIGAGEMAFDASGRLTQISDKSGHYMPDRVRVLQGLDAIANTGVDLSNVDLKLGTSVVGKAGQFLAREGWRIHPNNFQQLDTNSANTVLLGKPAGTWLLRQDGNFEGKISYVDRQGQIQHELLAVPRAVPSGTAAATQLGLAQVSLGLDTTKMVAPSAVAFAPLQQNRAAAGVRR